MGVPADASGSLAGRASGGPERSASARQPDLAPGPHPVSPTTSLVVFAVSVALLLMRSPTLLQYLNDPDHGYQLAVGRQVLFGKIPGIDIFIIYGPLVMLSSALGLWVSDSLLGETLLCAAGYAGAITSVHYLVARHGSRLATMFAFAAGHLLLARFYKWYVWLFPLVVLLLLQRRSQLAPERLRRWALVCGLVLGVEWLFRFDMGTTGLLAVAAFVAVVEFSPPSSGLARAGPRQLGRQLGALAFGFAIPLAAWFTFLALAGGMAAVPRYLSMIASGASGLASGMAEPLPPADWTRPLAPETTLALAYMLVPLTYALAGGIGLAAEWRGRATARSRLLLATALIGASVLHQAMYRQGGSHLLQVLPPAIVAASVLLSAFWEAPPPRGTVAQRALRIAGHAYSIAVALCGLALLEAGAGNLGPFDPWPRQRLAQLADPYGSGLEHPVLEAMAALEEHTSETDGVLVYPVKPQYYAFVDRPMSGMLHAYYPGVCTESPWRERKLQALLDDMPAIVVVPFNFLEPIENWKGGLPVRRAANMEIDELLRAEYTQVVYRQTRREGGIMLLERPE